MKSRMLLAGLVFLASTFVSANESASVEKNVDQLMNALVSADEATLKSLSSQHLSYGHSSGKIENQAEFIDQIVSGRSDFVKISLTNQTVTLSGDTALVRHELNADIADNGVPNTIRLGVLLVWQKEPTGWKLLARQAFKLP